MRPAFPGTLSTAGHFDQSSFPACLSHASEVSSKSRASPWFAARLLMSRFSASVQSNLKQVGMAYWQIVVYELYV